MNPRIRRLSADFEQMKQVFRKHPFIRVTGVQGNPPERYALEFRVMGLVPNDDDSFTKGQAHTAEVFLPLDYPRRPPLCRMTSPIFHPNIDPQKICIGDHWSAGQRLPQLIVRVAEMISYQSYNVKSPLNAVAAAWAEQNMSKLPLEAKDLSAGL